MVVFSDEVLKQARLLRQGGSKYFIATVVKIEGPAYRRPGARMLIKESGQHIGEISSGCLEGEVVQHALNINKLAYPFIVSFRVDEDDPILGFGSGCGGTVHVLIESSYPEREDDPFKLIEGTLSLRSPGVLTTVIRSNLKTIYSLGEHRLYRNNEAFDSVMESEVVSALKSVIKAGRTQIHRFHDYDILFEYLIPPIRVLVFGAGKESQTTARFATLLGWEVEIIGSRPQDEIKNLFPEEVTYHFVMHPEDIPRELLIDDRSAVIILTHQYKRDQAILSHVIDSEAGYIGLLGNRIRSEKILNEVYSKLGRYDNTEVFTPIGLNIGAERPEEIALSIIAEIQAVFTERTGGFLKELKEPIHSQVTTH